MFRKLRQKLAKAIWVDDEPQSNVIDLNEYRQRQRGFMDYATGRRVDIDPRTKREVFVDEI